MTDSLHSHNSNHRVKGFASRGLIESRLVGRGLVFRVRLESENVAGLARERSADRIERRKADCARLAGLEDRKVGQHHPIWRSS